MLGGWGAGGAAAVVAAAIEEFGLSDDALEAMLLGGESLLGR